PTTFLRGGRRFLKCPSSRRSRRAPPATGGKMFDSNSIIVGLEIGTSKVCAVVGEMTAEGALNIVGLGQARSTGVRKGEIVDGHAVEENIRAAVVEAEH